VTWAFVGGEQEIRRWSRTRQIAGSLPERVRFDLHYRSRSDTHTQVTVSGRLFGTYRVEPQIVFGSIDSGVPNRKRDDGLPDYDVPVEGILSPGHDGPTFLDLVWDKAPFATHGDFVAVVARLAEEFVNAGEFTTEEKDPVVAAAGRAVNELAP
jgi:hypothetical protein